MTQDTSFFLKKWHKDKLIFVLRPTPCTRSPSSSVVCAPTGKKEGIVHKQHLQFIETTSEIYNFQFYQKQLVPNPALFIYHSLAISFTPCLWISFVSFYLSVIGFNMLRGRDGYTFWMRWHHASQILLFLHPWIHKVCCVTLVNLSMYCMSYRLIFSYLLYRVCLYSKFNLKTFPSKFLLFQTIQRAYRDRL